MKALVYDQKQGSWKDTTGFWQVDLPEPKLGAGDGNNVILKMKFAGVCGSDRGIWNRTAFQEMIETSLAKEGKTQRIIGHELFAEVAEVGSAVTEVKVGDAVSAESHITCGKCYQCVRGDTHVCAEDIIIGIAADGCFAEYAKLPAKILWKTDPQNIEPELAAIQEPFGNAVHACTQTDLRDKTIAVLGCGAVGSLVIAVAKGMGAKQIIGIDPQASQLEIAKAMGADQTIQLQADTDLVEQVKALTGGVGVDVAMEMSGFNDSVNNALLVTRRGGHVIFFGLKSGDFVFKNFEKTIRNGLQMHCVIGRRIWDTWKITKEVLENRANGVQAKIKKYVLKDYQGSIIDFASFTREGFEQKLKDFPKLVFKF
jgi:threonine 3-dehydrogenase